MDTVTSSRRQPTFVLRRVSERRFRFFFQMADQRVYRGSLLDLPDGSFNISSQGPEEVMNTNETENNKPVTDASSKETQDDKQGREGRERIPGSEEGAGIGQSSEPNTFEPEEDPDATDKVTSE